MKRILLISILIVISQIVFGQKKYPKIDTLNSHEEVEKLVRTFYDSKYEKFTLNKNLDDYKSRYGKYGKTIIARELQIL